MGLNKSLVKLFSKQRLNRRRLRRALCKNSVAESLEVRVLLATTFTPVDMGSIRDAGPDGVGDSFNTTFP